MRSYGVSRITVRQATANLVERGLLVRGAGKGTFVSTQRVRQDLRSLTAFRDVLSAQGLQPETRLAEFGRREAPDSLRSALRLGDGHALYFRRVFSLDGAAVAATEVHLPPALVPLVSRADAEKLASHEILERFGGIRIEHAELTVKVATAVVELADDLGVEPGSALLLSERLSFTGDGLPVEHSSLFLRPEVGEFGLSVRHGTSLRPMIRTSEPS